MASLSIAKSALAKEALCWIAAVTGETELAAAPSFGEALRNGCALVRLARALAARSAINLKEWLESFEFFARTRKHVRADVVADLCCGHGLTGLLFAIFDKKVQRVLLVDARRPRASTRLVFTGEKDVVPVTIV